MNISHKQLLVAFAIIALSAGAFYYYRSQSHSDNVAIQASSCGSCYVVNPQTLATEPGYHKNPGGPCVAC